MKGVLHLICRIAVVLGAIALFTVPLHLFFDESDDPYGSGTDMVLLPPGVSGAYAQEDVATRNWGWWRPLPTPRPFPSVSPFPWLSPKPFPSPRPWPSSQPWPGISPFPAPSSQPSPRPSPGCFCMQEYAPVCGVDRKTYSNACMARCAGVPIKHPGECRRPWWPWSQ